MSMAFAWRATPSAIITTTIITCRKETRHPTPVIGYRDLGKIQP